MVADKFEGRARLRKQTKSGRRSASARRAAIAFTSWNFQLVVGAWCDNSGDNNSGKLFIHLRRIRRMVRCSVREEGGGMGEQRVRKGDRAGSRTSALPPRDVVKYVAIYTGDWRHWCLGSERVLLSLSPVPFPDLPNSPPALIVSASNPCAGGSGLPDQKSIREIPVPA